MERRTDNWSTFATGGCRRPSSPAGRPSVERQLVDRGRRERRGRSGAERRPSPAGLLVDLADGRGEKKKGAGRDVRPRGPRPPLPGTEGGGPAGAIGRSPPRPVHANAHALPQRPPSQPGAREVPAGSGEGARARGVLPDAAYPPPHTPRRGEGGAPRGGGGREGEGRGRREPLPSPDAEVTARERPGRSERGTTTASTPPAAGARAGGRGVRRSVARERASETNPCVEG
jgi:hypothetical protein